MDFIRVVHDKEESCAVRSRQALPEQLGRKAPSCMAALGTVLSLTDRLASCWWGCQGGDHMLEYLVGRSAASARGSLRLADAGYYDESLSITRNVGEIANLLSLFVHDPQSMAAWRAASRQQRINKFGPSAVRKAVVALGGPLPISEDRYHALCEVGVHVTPDTRPQAHNPLAMPVLGGEFQATGFVLALNELAMAMSFVGVFAAKLLGAKPDVRKQFAAAGRDLASNIGGIEILGDVPRLGELSAREIAEMIDRAAAEDRASLRLAVLRLFEPGAAPVDEP
jgi:hypothetical protein